MGAALGGGILVASRSEDVAVGIILHDGVVDMSPFPREWDCLAYRAHSSCLPLLPALWLGDREGLGQDPTVC